MFTFTNAVLKQRVHLINIIEPLRIKDKNASYAQPFK